jgi:hypothetical protein
VTTLVSSATGVSNVPAVVCFSAVAGLPAIAGDFVVTVALLLL